ncbi:non-ribosomal peptide synthetase [Microcoleus sp. FACHB-68]|uniref:non-ribosomal peptide synthetase family protein n=1 Tax=Microcoleus sp. FACHB-68 TaxID=2692826 RepID=UPI001684FA62|nr:non-ribosomal peptide synthetase [Microcoleus sp. FACHB-68]MBD1938356.1 amino acid adenylation domain-containing protein [Microcoleus sp. FACHB-68]
MQTITGFRLSPQQKYLWSLLQESPAYRAQCSLLIEGNLNQKTLKEALQAVINRHEILRTTFHRRPGVKVPIQVIESVTVPSWKFIDFTQSEPQDIQTKLQSILKEETSVNLEFDKSLLLRLSLIYLSENRYILIVSLPSLCADNRTLTNLAQEISQAYRACLQGEELSDEEIVQYVQFSEWQNELLEDEDAEAGKEFWNQQDFSTLANLKLPFENKRVEVPTRFEPNFSEDKIELSLVAKIEQAARKYNVSTSLFLLACWKILLWRLTGRETIIVNSAFDGRKYEELEPALGLFAKFLPLQTHLQDNFHFNEILQQIQQWERDAYKWQEYFLAEDIGNAILPFSFEFEEQPATYSAADISFSIVHQYVCFDRFKVKLSCQRQENFLLAQFHYDPAFIDEIAIRCLADQFHTLLESAANNPESVIGQLGILSERTRNQLLVEFNNTQVNYSQDQCIHKIFEEQVKRTPAQIALVFENQQLTYRELNDRSNKLANYLQKLGVEPETVVAICVERSLEMVVAMLGILKAGSAYLPLDPAMPADRIALMLQDAKVPVLLTQQHLVNNFGEHAAQVLCLDTEWKVIEKQAEDSIKPLKLTIPNPSNLAYVIYTSGSTGIPKGVAIEHRQLSNYLQGITDKLNLSAGANFALISTFAADLGHSVVFPSLCGGGCLHIISQERATDPEALADYCRQYPIDCLKIVPSHLQALLTASSPADILPRQRLILGGETLSWNLIETIKKYAPNCFILNHYGPTEATVGVLTYQVDSGEFAHISETVPLGCPLQNTQIYLLDSQLQPVPIGVPGEIYIGGAGLARGYLNQLKLTAEKFIVNPFNRETRLYKTGDLGRYLPDGNIEFLGRIDHQVKIRGFRIELGEIETVLSQHPAVRETVVVVREDKPGEKSLVAYINVNPKIQSPKSSEWRAFLKEKLPDYMMPSSFVVLKALPLTPNGKIDRQALPAPETLNTDLADTFVPPRTPVEEVLTGIWAKLLNLEKVGIHDNFFDLGGHSLLITQLLAKVRESFDVNLPLRSLFDFPTIAGLANSIDKQNANSFTLHPSKFALSAEAVLDSTIRPATQLIYSAKPTSIFLTGATGFLGAFLLNELLQKTQADIYCLVRSSDIESAKQRLKNSLECYSLWEERLSSRIIPVIGNLSEPLLGLSNEQFQTLASKLDVIYHNGAFVNFTYPYYALKNANVLGTQEILRLASAFKLKPVHFISTTSVFSPVIESGVQIVREQDNLTPGEALTGGYAQSKWVAEKLIEIARERGIPVSIYRPGRISGHSQTGVCNPSDFLYRAITGCIQLGCAPVHDRRMNIAPIDYVSRAIVHLSQQKELLGNTFHLANPQPFLLNELVDWMGSLGYPLERVSYDHWKAEIRNRAGESQENALYPLVGLFSEGDSETPKSKSGVLQFDCQNTLNGLAGTDIICPTVDINLFRTYFSYLIARGIVNAPKQNDELTTHKFA